MVDLEVRRKVAEALGWTEIRASKYRGIALTGLPPNETERTFVPAYEHDPAASKQLREKLRDKWALHLIGAANASSKAPYFCCNLYSGGVIAFDAIAETEELAVALCAIKALKD